MYLKPEIELDTDMCSFVFGETKATMYAKYKSLIASFMVRRGRLEWSDQTRDDGSPQRLLNFEETVCVTGALIAWSHDSAGGFGEYETCDVQRKLTEGGGIRFVEDDQQTELEESSTSYEQMSIQR